MLRSLPDWFGIESSIVRYVEDLSELESYVATRDERVVGFIAVRMHNPLSAEIEVIAVRPECHGSGAGRSLIDHVERLLQARGVEFLQVKTLGPSRPNEHYARTRDFYEHMGFRALEETNLWGPANPCLILVKRLETA
ncbi:MAG: GNAT family N-acetyltransferase [bacterium]